MIELNVNNKQVLEMYQNEVDGEITVNTKNADRELTNQYFISPGDMVMLLNYYRCQKENDNRIF